MIQPSAANARKNYIFLTCSCSKNVYKGSPNPMGKKEKNINTVLADPSKARSCSIHT